MKPTTRRRPTYRDDPFLIRRAFDEKPPLEFFTIFARLTGTINARHFAGYEPERVLLENVELVLRDDKWRLAVRFRPIGKYEPFCIIQQPDASHSLVELYEKLDFNDYLALNPLEYAPHVTN